MTMFRVGPAGIPGSLKTDMNTILNKKFGTTAQDYPPADWPADVNLLGPLPVKTASGAIAHIDDGADGVPVKNWLVTLPASLDGYSEVNGTKSGKNLFDKTNTSGIVTGYIDTTSFKTGNQNAKTVYISIKGGETYTVSKTAGLRFAIATSENIPTNGALYTSRKVNNTASSLYITAGANDKYLWAWVFLDGTDTGTLADMLASIQIEVGSTPTQYTAYTPIEQYTASLGRTIYGGQADIVTGEGSNGSILIDLSELTWNMDNDTRFRSRQTDYAGASGWSGDWQNTVSNRFVCENPATAFTNRSDYSFANIPQNYYNFDIKVPSGIFADATAFKTWLGNIDGNGTHAVVVIDRLNAETFTFTPITPTPETALGVNNFWADEGDSDVTYRADISLALQALGGGGRGLMGMMMQRPEEEQLTEEDPEEVPEEEAETNER